MERQACWAKNTLPKVIYSVVTIQDTMLAHTVVTGHNVIMVVHMVTCHHSNYYGHQHLKDGS